MEHTLLQPRHSPAYSPNLYRWLRQQHRRNPDRAIRDRVYRVTAGSLLNRRYHFAAGELMIGLPFENQPFADDFCGAQLIHVLVMGGQAMTMCYPGGMGGLEPVEDFWERYRAIGRCAIDTEHTQHFIGDAGRFVVHGDTRTCQWCGAQQHRSIHIKHIETEVWKAA